MNEILVVPDQGSEYSSRAKEAVNLANASQHYFFLRLQEQPMAIEPAGASIIGVMAAEQIDVSAKDQDTACSRPAIQHAATEYDLQRICDEEGER